MLVLRRGRTYERQQHCNGNQRSVHVVSWDKPSLRQRLHFHRQHCRQIPHDRIPAISRIGGAIHLSARGAEIDAALVESIHGHRVAQHVHVAVFLRQALGERFPLIAAGSAAEHAQLASIT